MASHLKSKIIHCTGGNKSHSRFTGVCDGYSRFQVKKLQQRTLENGRRKSEISRRLHFFQYVSYETATVLFMCFATQFSSYWTNWQSLIVKFLTFALIFVSAHNFFMSLNAGNVWKRSLFKNRRMLVFI